MYKSYVRPILDYNSITWSPYLVSDINLLESVQRTFTRKLFQKLNLNYNNYDNRLHLLGLDTLEVRRIKTDLIFIFKIITGHVDLTYTDFFQFNEVVQNYTLRRHKFYLKKPKLPKSSIASNFFTYRTIDIWNKLPSTIVNSQTLLDFKSKLNTLQITNYFNSRI